MRTFLRVLLAVLLLLLVAAAGMYAWLETTRVSADDLPVLKTGDIVFQESGSTQSMAISLASRSLYTHTGIIEIDTQGRAQVIEAAGPVRTRPLLEWLRDGTAGRITIKRLDALTADDAAKVAAAAHTYDGRPYDFYFYDDAEALYCSELVHRAFKEGAEIRVGKVEQVKDLDIDNAAVRAIIEQRWRRHPLCRETNATTFETCYGLILEQKLVTPAAVARDGKLTTIFSNFGVLGD